jgi:hypothetical protein
MSSNSLIYINGVLQDPNNLGVIPNMSTSTTYTWSPSITGTQGVMAQTLGSLAFGNLTYDFNSVSITNPEVKKYEVYESPEDVLVLSATWKRMRDEGRYGIVSKLLDKDLFNEITTADRTAATEIRDFYSKKIMMWNLKGNTITRYRQDLSKLIHTDGTTFKEDMLGLAYHLPAFYQYDNAIDEIRLATECKKIPHIGSGTKTLEPIKRVNKKNKRQNINEYWFKLVGSNSPVMLSLQAKNPLEHIWDNMFDNSEVLPITGNFIHKTRDDFEYYLVGDKWKLNMA